MATVHVSDPMPGYRTCGRPRIASPEYGDAVREEDCPAYLESQPCEIVREETVFTFGELGGLGGTNAKGPVAPQEAMIAHLPERSAVRYLPADGDWSCPACGFEMSAFSPEPRPQYMRLSEQDPNELRRRSLRQDRQADAALSLQERQVIATERLVEQGDQATRIAELERMLADMNARMDEKPKPKRAPA